MSTTTSRSIALRITDVAEANGSVSAAIVAACDKSDYLASGVVGPSFSTSGPGSGWSRQHDCNDYATRALADDYGAVGYVDSDDGRMATLDDDGKVVWTDGSIVEAHVPSHADVDAYPDAARAMLNAVKSGLIDGRVEDWFNVEALIDHSVEDALNRINGEIHGDHVIYYDDSTHRWYAQAASDLTELRILMGDTNAEISNDAYSHWCSNCTHDGEFGSREDAIASI